MHGICMTTATVLIWLGVAPITTSIQHKTRNNERQNENHHVLYGLNNTLQDESPPSFGSATTSGNVTVMSGESAYLVCSVINLGKNYVSWLRHKDINLISVGKSKYTQDSRYQIFHSELNDTWTLKINRVRKDDEGFFECQISTAQIVGRSIFLKVIDPEVEILAENGNKFAVAGSNLNLTCFISSNERQNLKWTHNSQEINHQTPRSGVFVITEHNESTVSHLVIKNLTIADSGQYTCSASAKSRTNVMVHVFDDDSAEAVTLNGSIKTSSSVYILFWYILVNFIT